jgi:hypothetical protein
LQKPANRAGRCGPADKYGAVPPRSSLSAVSMIEIAASKQNRRVVLVTPQLEACSPGEIIKNTLPL